MPNEMIGPELEIINSHIKQEGLQAARAVLPGYRWCEVRDTSRRQWLIEDPMRRFAALVLRRAELTLDANILMTTEILCWVLEGAEELQIRADGAVRVVVPNEQIWEDSLKKG